MLSRINTLFINELSKASLLRAFSPSLNARYQTRVKGSSQERKFLDGYPKRILARTLHRMAFWRIAPVHFSGGAILNLLGLQVLRFIHQNRIKVAGAVAPQFIPLRDHGVHRVPEFLDSQTLTTVRDFYERNKNLSKIYLRDFSELILYSNIPEISNELSSQPEFKEILNQLYERLDLERLFRELSGRELRVKPFISIVHHKSFTDIDYVAQEDGNNTPHRDVFYPSYKIFIYLNDVSEDNAAFIYYPDTHVMHSRSLFEVYKTSLRYYFREKWAKKPVNALAMYPTPPQPVSQTGLAGSAVFFNVAGIHQRGSYKRDKFRERIVLLIDFRQNDAFYPQSTHRWHQHKSG